MPHAIQIHDQGAPDVMEWVEVPDLQPGPGEALLRQTAVGLNYIDVYQRSGGYKLDLPSCIGMEGVGIVDAIGDGVEGIKVGDRVGYVMGPPGSYAEQRVYPADRLIPLPEDITETPWKAFFSKEGKLNSTA